jgi:hypothetical protein
MRGSRATYSIRNRFDRRCASADLAGGELHPGEEKTHDGAFNRELSDLIRRNIPDDLDRFGQNLAPGHSTSMDLFMRGY